MQTKIIRIQGRNAKIYKSDWLGWKDGKLVAVYSSSASGDRAIKARIVDGTSPAAHYGKWDVTK